MSLYLSRDFARTRRDLRTQLGRIRRLNRSNVELHRDNALARLHVEAFRMNHSEDISRVIQVVWDGLKTCGLPIEGISISVVVPGTF